MNPPQPAARTRALFENWALLREVSPGLYTSLPETDQVEPYDRWAGAYDAVVGRALYQRVLWGTSPAAITRFGRQALDAAGGEPLADIACGSLLFTAQMYREAPSVPAVLVDRSLGMLRRAMPRLSSGRQEDLVLLRADAASLPVRSHVFAAVLSLNLLHVPCDRAAIVAECGRVLIPGRGRLFVSSLIRSGRWSDAALSLFQRTGQLGAPLTADELAETVAGDWGRVESQHVEGNMAFVVVRHCG